MEKQEILEELEKILKDEPWNATINLRKFIDRLKKSYVPKQRTSQQNRALWLYFRLVSDELNRGGLDLKKVLKPSVDIQWDEKNFHDYMWIPLQKAILHTNSTTKLKKLEDINKVYDHLHRFLSTKKEGKDWSVDVPFPSEQDVNNYKLDAMHGK